MVFLVLAWLFLCVVSEIFEEKKSRAAGIATAPRVITDGFEFSVMRAIVAYRDAAAAPCYERSG
jgi:hypothetical protein